MRFFKIITARPWLGEETAYSAEFDAALGADGLATLKTKRMGLFIFIGVATALFGLFAVAYYMRMMMGGWHMLMEPLILWPNTLILMVGGGLMQWASWLSKQGNVPRAKQAFFAGGIAGLLFLGGQLLAWQELIELGCYAEVNPANAFFYVITGLHGLHLMGGLFVWGNALFKTMGDASPAAITASIELCDYYWHFMLAVWIAIFALLVVT
ncbi:MAG: cytochrome c oxidase subunit 3 [Kordiimonadaceae bacterium]|nr:cytochrome c oxidase subunit 3 [Kordiimonadaceae bacterium]